MGSERGGPVEGKRSISGRACLPLLIAMLTLGTILLGSFAAVAMALIRA